MTSWRYTGITAQCSDHRLRAACGLWLAAPRAQRSAGGVGAWCMALKAIGRALRIISPRYIDNTDQQAEPCLYFPQSTFCSAAGALWAAAAAMAAAIAALLLDLSKAASS